MATREAEAREYMHPSAPVKPDCIARAIVFGSDAELEDACAVFVAAREACRALTVDLLIPVTLDLDEPMPSYDANGSEVRP
jgi:hypothetical protein